MGLFHCPLGALSYGDEACIRCGLCSAVTAQEKRAAAEIMRAWIREHGSSHSDIKIRKIAVCGKGGAGNFIRPGRDGNTARRRLPAPSAGLRRTAGYDPLPAPVKKAARKWLFSGNNRIFVTN